MIGCTETLCASCDHRDVCKLRDEFLKAQQTVDDVTVSLGDHKLKRLRDFDYINPVNLQCKHWKMKSQGGGIR